MTLALIALGGVAALLGTRLAALAFAGAVVAAVLDVSSNPVGSPASDASLAAIAAWTAATAAGWLLLTRQSPRRLGLPALGLAGALAAGAAPNGAVLLGCWAIATAAAVLCRSEDARGRRWAVSLCALDVIVVASVASTAGRGFEAWPQTLGTLAAIALLACAFLRATLAAGPDDVNALPGLLVVRAQSAVLAILAIAAGSPGVSEAAVAVAALAFAGAPFAARRTRVVDAVQELALVVMALASVRAGWGPEGWVWGALAAGTLIHHLRLMVARTQAGPFGAALLVSAGIGVPFLPVLMAQLEGATAGPRWLGGVMLIGLLAGLAGRARLAEPPQRRRATDLDEVRAGVVVAAASVTALIAALVTLPSPPAAAVAFGPPLWAGVLVLATGAAGSRLARVVSRQRPPLWRLELPSALTKRVVLIDRWATDRVLWAALGALAAAAAAMWVVGATRGFL